MTQEVQGPESEAGLVKRARAGDGRAFDLLVSRYKRPVYPLSLRLCGNTHDAEDVLQEAFLQVFRKLHSFRGASKFSTWLYRVATNAALMHRRRHKGRRTESLDSYLPEFRRDGRHKRVDVDYSAAARIEATVHGHQLSKLLLDALSRLPDAYRTAVVLCDLQEMASGDAAAVLRVNAQTLRQRVHRARLMLRGYL